MKGAYQLYDLLHSSDTPAITKEALEQICLKNHVPFLEESITTLFDLDSSRHSLLPEEIFLGQDPERQIFLRKIIRSAPRK